MINKVFARVFLPFFLIFLVACSSERVSVDSVGSESLIQTFPTVDGTSFNEIASNTTEGSNQLYSPGSELSKRSIYFDFDSSVIKLEFQDLVKAHSKFLLENPSRSIVIQGNTDSRGSSEYNLALGQRRSAAVKSTIRVLGVPEIQVEAVSFGKEKLRALGNDEASHAENRRADIVYNGE